MTGESDLEPVFPQVPDEGPEGVRDAADALEAAEVVLMESHEGERLSTWLLSSKIGIRSKVEVIHH